MLAGIGRFVTNVARHGVPFGGIVGRDWHPVTAVAVYWTESLLLALATVSLCWLLQRRIRGAIDEGDAAGDAAALRALDEQRRGLKAAGVVPGDVLIFHVGSLLIFGAFVAGLLIILVGNGRLDEPIRWPEILQGVEAMLVIVAIGWTIDFWTFHRFTILHVQSRVNACNTRWALFWLLGFIGTMMMVFSGRPAVFFGVFAVLKVTFESLGGLARLFGWKSLRDRAAVPATLQESR